ncbi:MAG: endolytic transglycosylase MltG [Clostridia bacterium]|nr:endolytic transglycosylase MltG [Clostridia bacterium]
MAAKSKKTQISKKAVIAVFAVAVIIILINVFGFSNRLKENKTVSIEPGTTTPQIAGILKKEKVISSKTLFMLKVKLSDYNGQLKYGEFEFSPDDDYDDVIKIIATNGAQKNTITVTIPEGYSVEKIIDKLCESGLSVRKDYETALKDDYDYEFLTKINPSDKCFYKLEGFLFPSTYEFYADSSAHEIIDKMLGEFEKQYKTVSSSYDNIFEIITKASLIEREAKVDADRRKIAGVIENRLNDDMLLQIDATVIYAISQGKYNVDKVLYKDLEFDSPYNTYKYKGLPIGPISVPGIESIKAALNPEKHNYLYYRVDTSKNDGSHIFTETFDEHVNANK